jgi:carbamate kinase
MNGTASASEDAVSDRDRTADGLMSAFKTDMLVILVATSSGSSEKNLL